jgi:hypothetical protein
MRAALSLESKRIVMSKTLSFASFTAVSALLLSAAAQAQCPEIGPVQTYAINPTNQYLTCNCFAPGEEAGQYFPIAVIPAADYPIKITKIAIGWWSQSGGQGVSVEDSINVYANGTFPQPGALVASIGAPQMADGGLNEFDVTANNIQINTPGFYVTLRFANSNDATVNPQPYPATMVNDGPSGCTNGRNVVKAVSPFSGWFAYCGGPLSLGGSGDWVMHVKYEKVNCGGGGLTLGPCDPGQSGNTGEGCAHSFGMGGKLDASGTPSVSNDSVVLHITNLPPTTNALFFQGNNKVNGGNGAQFGDGLLCVNGGVVRLGQKVTSGGAADYGAGVGSDPLVSVRGVVPLTGATRRYQTWFRNAAAFCTPSTFNLTNGLEIVWAP